MAELTLRQVTIRNWATIREAALAFPNKGVVLVTGVNATARGGMESVGSGKTSLGEAISKSLLGITGRYQHLGHFSPTQKGNLYVRLDLELKGKPLIVENGYKCAELSKTGEGLRYQYDDQPPVERAHINNTREELIRMLGITPELASWTVFLDGDRLKFNRLSQEESVELLLASLRQPPWTAYHERALKFLRVKKEQVGKLEATFGTIQDEQARAEQAVVDAERDLETEQKQFEQQKEKCRQTLAHIEQSLTEHNETLLRLSDERRAIKKQLKEIEDQRADTAASLEKQHKELESQVLELSQEYEQLLIRRTEAKTDLDREKGVLKTMQAVPENCPTCGKAWDKAHSAEEIASQKNKVAMATSVHNKYIVESEALDEKITDVEREAANVLGQMTKLHSGANTEELSLEYEANEKQGEATANLIETLKKRQADLERGPDATRLNAAKTVLEERKSKLA